MPLRDDWDGDELEARVARATGRGVIAIGEHVVVDGKQFAHVQFGTLRRSIHLAPENYIGSADEAMATLGDLPNVEEPSLVDDDPVVQAGSWLPYACVEETGRNHKFMTPAVEGMIGPRSDAAMQRAFAEEGLVL